MSTLTQVGFIFLSRPCHITWLRLKSPHSFRNTNAATNYNIIISLSAFCGFALALQENEIKNCRFVRHKLRKYLSCLQSVLYETCYAVCGHPVQSIAQCISQKPLKDTHRSRSCGFDNVDRHRPT